MPRHQLEVIHLMRSASSLSTRLGIECLSSASSLISSELKEPNEFSCCISAVLEIED